jgi:hypothetical protein
MPPENALRTGDGQITVRHASRSCPLVALEGIGMSASQLVGIRRPLHRYRFILILLSQNSGKSDQQRDFLRPLKKR